MKIYTIGDVHGEFSKLKNLIEQLPLEKGDKIIFLGDYVDRGNDVYACIEFLIELSKKYSCVFINGNHDFQWLHGLLNEKNGVFDFSLINQGARESFNSYERRDINPKVHIDFFKSLVTYHIENNMFFTHGGFNRHEFIQNQKEFIFIWDRDLWNSALSYEHSTKEFSFRIKDKFKKIFIGHTPVNMWNHNTPQKAAMIWNLDTGAGKYKKTGKLSAIEVYSEKIYQSNEILVQSKN